MDSICDKVEITSSDANTKKLILAAPGVLFAIIINKTSGQALKLSGSSKPQLQSSRSSMAAASHLEKDS